MHFRLLGRLDVTASDGSPIALSGSLARAIVARLTLAGGRPVPRDALIDELWSERGARNPVNALQVQMTKLRTAFAERGEAGRLAMLAGGYRLALDDEDHVDVTVFETSVRRGRERLRAGAHEEAEELLRSGLDLWRGRALEDLTGMVFEGERRRLDELRLTALEDAAHVGLERGRAEELISELTTLLADHPFREKLRGQLMLALYRSGRHAEALDLFHHGRVLLDAELGLAPSPELRALQSAILEHDPALMTSNVVRSEAAERPPASARSGSGKTEGNLSRSPGPYVGRRGALRALRETIIRERLVTLLGPGGVGKTRLALEALSRPDSPVEALWWIDLAVTGEDGVLAALATTLGLSDASVATDQRPLDFLRRVVSSLENRTTIVAFDNCEHVLDAVAPLVKTLLDACPQLTVVATSREPLGIAYEAHFTVEPMTAEEAGELFTLRAAKINPSFAAGPDARQDVLTLCRRLDGLPLAVELAAAHVRMLSVAEIDRRLDDRFALLVKGERTAPARHRTLRAVLDWSYALLGGAEQEVLSELALRVGGTALDDAERTGPPGPETTGTPTAGHGGGLLPILTQLVDKSMLFTVPGAQGTRFQMLETVREYALARLRTEGRLQQAEERFVSWALDFAAEHSAALHSREQSAHCLHIAEETANLRAGSELLVRQGRAAEALFLESSLGYFWYVSGREEEGIDRLARTLDAYDSEPGTSDPERPPGPREEWALTYTFAWLAWLNHVAGRHESALGYEERYRAAWRQARNPDVAVIGPVYEALYARLTADEDRGDLFARAEAGIAGTAFQWDRAVLQYNWSTYCLHNGDPDAAGEHALYGIEAARAADDPFALAICLTARGDAQESAGRREEARSLWSEASEILRTMDARSRWAYRALRLAYLDIGEGDHDRADRRIAEVERIAAEVISYDLAYAGANLRAVVLAARSRFTEAAAALREVASAEAAPRHRRAVASLALTVCGDGGPADGERLADGRREAAAIIEPLARDAVGLLLAEATERGSTEPGRRYALHERLARSPSVRAAFC
ncbi:AfsR/SARP family transcriptional regulator [Streptomyces goshikiensis]|uniref:AfsR/SARP family transcriptional regulator n=1 Tax=Streptomyces goshikiensis TaxID=1942 RepID=UPI0037B21604